MCPHGYHHSGFVVTHAIGRIISWKIFIEIHTKGGQLQVYGNFLEPPYTIIFINSLKEEILNISLLKPLVWWRYIGISEHREEKLQKILDALNCYHPNI